MPVREDGDGRRILATSVRRGRLAEGAEGKRPCLCGRRGVETNGHFGTIMWFLCKLILELLAIYSRILESLFRLFKDIKMMTHLKVL